MKDNKAKILPFKIDLSEILNNLEKSKSLTLVNVGNVAAKSYLISEVSKRTDFRNIFWASTDERADSIFSTAEIFFNEKIFLIPAECSIEKFYELRQALKSKDKNLFLFEDLESILDQDFPEDSDIKAGKVTLKVGDKVQVFDLFSQLEKIGYTSAEDKFLNPGEFIRRGENFFLFPANDTQCVRIEINGDEIEGITEFEQIEDSETGVGKCSQKKEIEIFPKKFDSLNGKFIDLIKNCDQSCVISDDLDSEIFSKMNGGAAKFNKIKFTTFPENDEIFFHLNFFSVLPFYTIPDFVVDIKERLRREFDIVIGTKKFDEIEKIFRDNDVMFTEDLDCTNPSTVKIIKFAGKEFLPHSFQNNERQMLFLTDREIFQFHRSSRQKKAVSGVNFDLMTSLKPGNFVIHLEHGVAQFDGIVRREIGAEKNMSTREYLKLNYAANDKLFVPVESAEKITKFIGDDDPKLNRLGSTDWGKQQSKLKKETERIAKELLKIYAARELAKSKKFPEDDGMMMEFCESFPYEPTPGQASSWADVKKDLETPKPMDRLVCGDVGFGKTEIAMRAAFKTFRAGKQCAILAPITILAEQHFQSFEKRIAGRDYGVKIALLSRFQTAADQRKILSDLEHGLVDIVVGTHRLLSDDIKFKNLGLLIIDEEQRFGVSQKEKLKKFRSEVGLLTLTATPIPRTLNMSLNRLKDISTITTPPPGRLPVVTEVRRYNLNLIRERILHEKARGGQIYFLHNEVRTIDALGEQLKSLIPECKFIVAHGQLAAPELEKRINSFKNAEADVLIASTIIENGIDLANANTLIVDRAEKFGLSQLYQLRGRVGRSRTQAYAYFLYSGQKLELEAKKRLRAIVEASELGSGFQIAMRDLEIRGAGEILGASQSGTMKTVGVSHFMRVLNKTVEEMKSGEISAEVEEEENVTVEVPLSAYIPPNFIPNADEKIQVYKELASAGSPEALKDLRKDLVEDYGSLPTEVESLLRVIRLKMSLKDSNLVGVKINRASHKKYEVVLRMGTKFTPDQIFPLIQNSKNKWVITATAIKLSLEKLPVDWFQVILKDIELMKVKKKLK
ncbi:MAG: transcription-repair coupling factor [Candidatus Peregrinibacteria bacterium]|nr:transcription-repair coupling factor [Candidatus Peregrinibacteria bacterium]